MCNSSEFQSNKFPTSNTIRNKFHNRRRRGVSLIETALVLAIFAIVATSLIRLSNENVEQTRIVAAAQKMNEVKLGAEAFIQSNIAELTDSAPLAPDAQVIIAGRTASNQGVPDGSLQEENFLADSFIDLNSYNQRHALLIQRTANNRLNALITTYNGQVIPDDTLGSIAKLLGASGGYTPTNPLPGDNGQVLGVFGGWRTQTTDWGPAETRPSAGTFTTTLQFSAGNLITGHLYRNNIGITEANRMNTAIDMNSNAINNVQQISGSPDLVVNSNLWVEHDLDVKKNLIVQENVNSSGKIVAEDSIETKADLVVGTDVLVGEDLTVSDSITSESLNVTVDANVEGTVTTNLIAATQTEINSKAIDHNNNRVFNSDVTVSDLLPNMVFQYSYRVSESNNLVYKPVCTGGSQNSRIFVQPVSLSLKFEPDFRFSVVRRNGNIIDIKLISDSTYIDNVGSISTVDFNETFWKVIWFGESRAGINREAIAQTYCFYG